VLLRAVTTIASESLEQRGHRVLLEVPALTSRATESGQFGPYLLLEELAIGGMAEIHLAKTRGVAGFEKHCALKIIHRHLADDDTFVQMLVEEAKLAVQLSHVNIAQIFDLGQVNDRYYIAMEYVDGLDLDQLSAQLRACNQPFPLDCAVFIARETCAALEHAHTGRGRDGTPLEIIHRDVSPQNLMLSKAGEVKLVDFGIAKAACRRFGTQPGCIKGKYLYMSPEQLRGAAIDHRTDIYSIGLVLHETLTGRMGTARDVESLAQLVNVRNVPSMRDLRADIPPELDSIVMRALERDPNRRWQSARDLQLALTSFLSRYSEQFTPARLAELIAGKAQEAPSHTVVTPRVATPTAGEEQVVPVVLTDEPQSEPTLEAFARTTLITRGFSQWLEGLAAADGVAKPAEESASALATAPTERKGDGVAAERAPEAQSTPSAVPSAPPPLGLGAAVDASAKPSSPPAAVEILVRSPASPFASDPQPQPQPLPMAPETLAPPPSQGLGTRDPDVARMPAVLEALLPPPPPLTGMRDPKADAAGNTSETSDDVWTIRLDPQSFAAGARPQVEPIAFASEAPRWPTRRIALLALALLLSGIIAGLGTARLLMGAGAAQAGTGQAVAADSKARPLSGVSIAGTPAPAIEGALPTGAATSAAKP
jgi:serine/threonine protein kinase